ncbi:MAG: c-type cytochrome [Gammaproteobacteria bacterium]|nr:c-type cytochrome [Gammaproteobacteria bacterium]
MHYFKTLALSLCATLAFATDVPDPRELSGGSTTVFKTGINAYSLPAANISFEERLKFSSGNSFFRNPWVTAPASTASRDGLGPLFNTNGCQNCHIKDGRGHPPEADTTNNVSLLVRISIPTSTGTTTEEPNYGGQLQDFAIPGAEPEGQIKITYQPVSFTFGDGSVIELRQPTLEITDLKYGPLHPTTLLSARIAPPMIGLGLLESISAKDILKHADAKDKNQDGISGKPNYVLDVQTNKKVLGRFGWKAGQPTILQQSAAAFNGDIGITSTLFPKDDCTNAQTACLKAVDGGTPELETNILDLVNFYSHHLAVPARRDITNPITLRGEQLFRDAKCNACHVETFTTAKHNDFPALSQQTIHPYTDLLLHDMGKGLADNRPDGDANGQEWRTPPLWGIGYTQEVNGHTFFLHDGRARNLTEAILWHGGEAQDAQHAFINMPTADREALIKFLESL